MASEKFVARWKFAEATAISMFIYFVVLENVYIKNIALFASIYALFLSLFLTFWHCANKFSSLDFVVKRINWKIRNKMKLDEVRRRRRKSSISHNGGNENTLRTIHQQMNSCTLPTTLRSFRATFHNCDFLSFFFCTYKYFQSNWCDGFIYIQMVLRVFFFVWETEWFFRFILFKLYISWIYSCEFINFRKFESIFCYSLLINVFGFNVVKTCVLSLYIWCVHMNTWLFCDVESCFNIRMYCEWTDWHILRMILTLEWLNAQIERDRWMSWLKHPRFCLYKSSVVSFYSFIC